MTHHTPSTEEKFNTVIDKNTFYFFNPSFETDYEGHINSLTELLLVLKNNVESDGLKKETFEKLLAEKENGLKVLLALTGISNETLKRLTTLIRVTDDPELNSLVLKNEWCSDKDVSDLNEWSDSTISKMVKKNECFRQGLINLFFEGSTVPFLAKTLPLFELKKLSISKLSFELPGLIDTIIRYKEKGSYSGRRENNAESAIKAILDKHEITYSNGDLGELVANAFDSKRTMDFIIPDKTNPKIIIESSYLVTTSSGQGDKSKTEIQVKNLLETHYPEAKFFGFVDGIGWYVRKGDLRRMVSAYSDVFTFHEDELDRFEKYLMESFNEDK